MEKELWEGSFENPHENEVLVKKAFNTFGNSRAELLKSMQQLVFPGEEE